VNSTRTSSEFTTLQPTWQEEKEAAQEGKTQEEPWSQQELPRKEAAKDAAQ
jgi:hypothetical protein